MIDISRRKDILMHYASPYYDPVKAHEYYEQHKHLKGRPTGRLTNEGKQFWKVTKTNIDQAKKIDNDEARLVKIYNVQQFQNKEQRAMIQAKLTELLNTINNKYKSDTETLTETQKQQREKIANELKDNVRKAVSDLQVKKVQIKEKYEGIYQDEYDKIASEYTKPKKSLKK